MHCARMFSSGSFSPLCLSTPVSMQPSRSRVLVSPDARRSRISLSTVAFMNALSRSYCRSLRFCRRETAAGCVLRDCDVARVRTIAWTNGCGVSR